MPRTLSPRTFGPRSLSSRSSGGAAVAASDELSPWQEEWQEATPDIFAGLSRRIRVNVKNRPTTAASLNTTTGVRSGAVEASIDCDGIRSTGIDQASISAGGGSAFIETITYAVQSVDIPTAYGAPREGWSVTDPRGSQNEYEVVSVRREAEGAIYSLVCRANKKGSTKAALEG